MKKHIFLGIMLVSVLSTILTSILICMVFYSSILENTKIEVKSYIRENKNIKFDLNDTKFLSNNSNFRITVIDSSGEVKYDNFLPISELDKHLDRKEIKDAVKKGEGESIRFSDTLKKEAYYYAIKLPDNNIFRVSKAIESVWEIILNAIPMIALIILIVAFISYKSAKKLTKKIIEPINKIDFETELNAPYDELEPLVRAIEIKNEKISEQIKDLKKQAYTISAIMDSMKEGIVLIDKEGEILSINKSANDFVDLNISNNLFEIIKDEKFIENAEATFLKQTRDMNIEILSKNYNVFFTSIKNYGALILFLDITDKLLAEKMRREFSANVSHELKTPLTSIYGYAEMLNNNMVKEEDKSRFLIKIKDEADRLIKMIEEIILISKLDEAEGKIEQTFENVNITAVAKETIDSLSLKAKENNVSLKFNADTVYMMANRSMIYELFYNLIDNAIKYNVKDGSVTVNIQKNSHIEIEITDTGIGIPEKVKDKVFERFFRVDKSRSKKTGGSGLGLSIVKHIVLIHSGKVSLLSELDKGTKITIKF